MHKIIGPGHVSDMKGITYATHAVQHNLSLHRYLHPKLPENRNLSSLTRWGLEHQSLNRQQVPQSMVDAARVCMTRYQQGPTKAQHFQGGPSIFLRIDEFPKARLHDATREGTTRLRGVS